MKRLALAAALCTVPALAGAQSYSSALPVSPAERRAIEARLSAILDYAGTDEVSTFRLPTGRQVSVRTYRRVQRAGGQPCRGYRIDLTGTGSHTAVDGFRCRAREGNAWLIAEPEIIVAQEGTPLDLRRGRVAVSGREDTPDRLYADDTLFNSGNADTLAAAPPSPPPVPRPAPRDRDAEATAAAAPADEGAADETSATSVRPSEAVQPSEKESEVGQTTLVRTLAPPAAADASAPSGGQVRQAEPREDAGGTASADPPAAEPLTRTAAPQVPDAPDPVPAIPAAPQTAATADAPSGEAPSRVVGSPSADTDTAAEYAASPAILSALVSLGYLPAGDPAPEAVRRAVAEFARDERVALPIPAEALAQRLEAAQRRSGALPLCGDTPDALCIADR